MERSRGVFLIFLILFFFLTPDTTKPSRGQRARLDNRVSKEYQALEQLRQSSYGQLPSPSSQLPAHNATRLVDDGDFSWSLLPEILRRARSQYLEIFLNTDKVTEKDVLAGSEVVYTAAVEHPLPFYRNASGTIHGDFTRRPLSGKGYTDSNGTAPYSDDRQDVRKYWKNITESSGGLSFGLQMDEKDTPAGATVQEISADMAVQTASSPGSGWEIKMSGLHYPRTGSIIMTTTSEKFPGIFMLPHFVRAENEFSQSKMFLNHSLSEMIIDLEMSVDDRPSPSSSVSGEHGLSSFYAPSCEFIAYLQQQPVRFQNLELESDRVMELVKRIEDELRFPQGAPIPEAPPMTFTALVFSPDCGFTLESTPTRETNKSHVLFGPKTEVHWVLIRRLLLALIIALGLQVSLLKRQMDEASTPSMRSRTSYYSIAMMAMGDGLMMGSLTAFSLIYETGFLIFISAGFLCFLNFAFLEMKFIYDIWLVQASQSRSDDSQASRNERTSPSSNEATALPVGLPAPVAAQQSADVGAASVILPPDQDVESAVEEDSRISANATTPSNATQNRVDFQTFYSRFNCIMLALGFFSLWASSWPKSLRSVYIGMISFVYLSFWIPQIYRNVVRNCRQAFTWEYVIGISILRLLPVMYCYIKSSSILSLDTEPITGAFLSLWVILQIMALAVQQLLGPRLFVKESWCPPAYDYHPLLQMDDGDVESGSLLPVDFLASASEAKDVDDTKHKGSNGNFKVFDCAICMNEIQVPVVHNKDAADRSYYGAGLLGRRIYMVTPCRHIFHTECLEGWMRFRLVCPICRESLPPL